MSRTQSLNFQHLHRTSLGGLGQTASKVTDGDKWGQMVTDGDGETLKNGSKMIQKPKANDAPETHLNS